MNIQQQLSTRNLFSWEIKSFIVWKGQTNFIHSGGISAALNISFLFVRRKTLKIIFGWQNEYCDVPCCLWKSVIYNASVTTNKLVHCYELSSKQNFLWQFSLHKRFMQKIFLGSFHGYPGAIYLLKVNSRDNIQINEICSELKYSSLQF